MTRRAARVAARADRDTRPVARRLVALRAFHVWHREQMVTVPPGDIHDMALLAILQHGPDPSLLEWRE